MGHFATSVDRLSRITLTFGCTWGRTRPRSPVPRDDLGHDRAAFVEKECFAARQPLTKVGHVLREAGMNGALRPIGQFENDAEHGF